MKLPAGRLTIEYDEFGGPKTVIVDTKGLSPGEYRTNLYGIIPISLVVEGKPSEKPKPSYCQMAGRWAR